MTPVGFRVVPLYYGSCVPVVSSLPPSVERTSGKYTGHNNVHEVFGTEQDKFKISTTVLTDELTVLWCFYGRIESCKPQTEKGLSNSMK